MDFQQRPGHDHDTGGGDRHRRDGRGELEYAGPPPGEGTPLQEATRVEEEETDTGQGRGQPETEGQHDEQTEPGAPDRDGAQQR